MVKSGERDCAVNRARLTFCQKQENINKKLSTIPPCHIVIPNLLFKMSQILININVHIMTEIEKFLNEQFTQVITEDKMGIKCLYRHKDRLIDDGVVFFEFAKKKWSKKPIISKRQFVIVDADMGDVLQFLNQYYNLSEDDFNSIRHYIVNTSIKKVEEFFGED